MPTYTCYAPAHLSRHWPRFSPTVCLSKYVCITTIKYKLHPRKTTDHDDWPHRPRRMTTKKTDTTTKKNADWPRIATDHEEQLTTTTDHDDWPQYDSAPFWLTRTRPCATFDIRGHVWVESFHCFANCERTVRCVHCKTTCLHNFSTYEDMYMCNN